MNLYFAYGSNLNVQDWHSWCRRNNFPKGLLRFKSVGYLPDHKLAFTHYSDDRKGGVLDVRPRKGSLVPGVVFEVNEEGWRALHSKEGFRNNGARDSYKPFDWVALDDAGVEIPVTAYRVVKPQSYVRPARAYLEVVREGYERFELPDDVLNAAAKNEKSASMCDGLFVYGTLLRGESRFPILQGHGLECTLLAETRGRLLDCGSYPGLIDNISASSTVQGEFVRLRNIEAALAELDEIEGFNDFGQPGSLFRRTLIQAHVGEGRFRLAWCYGLAAGRDESAIIPSGDWREHCGQRDAFFDALIACHTGGDEQQIARAIARSHPFGSGDQEFNVRSLMPLREALIWGEISERKLAQASGKWVAIPSRRY